MKKILLSLAVVTGLAACTSKQQETTQRDIQLLTDSAVYTNNNVYSDTVVAFQPELPPVQQPSAPKPEPKRKAPKKQIHTPAVVHTPAPIIPEHAPAPEPSVATPPIVSSGNQGSSGHEGQTASTPEVQKKKGWDNATKGAVIGGAAGAAGGAIIVSKKKGVGAAVGAVVGAASGYIIGKDMDKKQKQK